MDTRKYAPDRSGPNLLAWIGLVLLAIYLWLENDRISSWIAILGVTVIGLAVVWWMRQLPKLIIQCPVCDSGLSISLNVSTSQLISLLKTEEFDYDKMPAQSFPELRAILENPYEPTDEGPTPREYRKLKRKICDCKQLDVEVGRTVITKNACAVCNHQLIVVIRTDGVTEVLSEEFDVAVCAFMELRRKAQEELAQVKEAVKQNPGSDSLKSHSNTVAFRLKRIDSQINRIIEDWAFSREHAEWQLERDIQR